MVFSMAIQLRSGGDNDSISFIHTHFGSGRYRQPLVRGFPSCKRVSSVCTNFCSSCRLSHKLDLLLSVPCTQDCTRTLVFLYAPRTSSLPRTLLPCSFLLKNIVNTLNWSFHQTTCRISSLITNESRLIYLSKLYDD